MKKIISTSKAPGAVGPYVQAVLQDDTLYTSGQIPIDPATGEIVKDCIYAQTEQSLKNLSAVIEEAGMTLANVIKTTVFITDMNDFAKVNEVYAKFFTESFPARSCVQVAALPKGAKVEIECVAKK